MIETETERELKALDNYWFWETPAEANHIESMVDTLKIVIPAAELKYLLKKSALKQQSEAEWKIERVKNCCFDEIEETETGRYSCKESTLANDILEILEGKVK